jgi:hypothetical protein
VSCCALQSQFAITLRKGAMFYTTCSHAVNTVCMSVHLSVLADHLPGVEEEGNRPPLRLPTCDHPVRRRLEQLVAPPCAPCIKIKTQQIAPPCEAFKKSLLHLAKHSKNQNFTNCSILHTMYKNKNLKNRWPFFKKK